MPPVATQRFCKLDRGVSNRLSENVKRGGNKRWICERELPARGAGREGERLVAECETSQRSRSNQPQLWHRLTLEELSFGNVHLFFDVTVFSCVVSWALRRANCKKRFPFCILTQTPFVHGGRSHNKASLFLYSCFGKFLFGNWVIKLRFT